MTLDELMRLLRKIKKVHPEAGGAFIEASSFTDNIRFEISNVGYTKRYKTYRILLED